MPIRVFVCAVLMGMIGCDRIERDFGVMIVVPPGYTGVIRIIFGEHGSEPPVKNGNVIFRIPPDGILRVAGDNPFLKLGTIEVISASGEGIPNADQIFAQDRKVKPEEGLFRMVGGTNDGSEFWAVIGTESDARNARLLLHEQEGER